MAEIRPLERTDLPAVAALLHAELIRQTPEQQISEFMATRLIEDPWSDEELPSLVAVEDGQLIGFIGSQVRRVRHQDRAMSGVCVSDLTVAAGHRGGAAGALLLRRILTGGQDFTFSDTANETVARIWQAFGGHLDHARACDWMVVLRPIRWARMLGTDVLRRRLGQGNAPVGAFPFRPETQRSRHRAFPLQPDVAGEDVDTATIVEHLPDLMRGRRLWVDYDEQFLEHQFRAMESHFNGRVIRRLVRRDERPVGWYAYVQNRRGVCRVLYLLTTPADPDADAVLADLATHARSQGSALIAGRHEPHLTLPLQRRFGPVLGFAQRPVVHCHDPEILATLATGASVLTRFDGEWYLT